MNLAADSAQAEPIAEDAIREALAHVLGSQRFRDVRRLSRFLEFVVHETLDGRGDRLKGFVIACEVFDKDDPSDAQSTTIVRVEAGRLRRRLADYYAEEGAGDPIRISIPKGGYRPVFANDRTFASAEPPGLEPGAGLLRGTPPARRRAFAAAGIALIAAVLLVFNAEKVIVDSPPTPDESDHAIAKAEMLIGVMPLESSDDEEAERQAMLIADSLVAALSKRPDLGVMALSSTRYFRQEAFSYKDMQAAFGVTHVISGDLQKSADSHDYLLMLHDARSGRTLWSARYEGVTQNEQQDLINRALSAVYNELNLDAATNGDKPLANDLNSYALFRQATELTHPPSNKLRVETSLQIYGRLMASEPENANGYSGAAYAHAALLWWGNSEDPEMEAARVDEFATRALTLDENSALSHVALGMKQMYLENQDRAVAHLEDAVRAEPNNAFALSVLAMFKVYAGQAERSLELANRAIELDPLAARTPYWNILGMIHYHLGNYEASIDALEENLRRGGPQPRSINYYLAAALFNSGDKDRAKSIVQELGADQSDKLWQAWVYRNYADGQQYHNLMEPLINLGVEDYFAIAGRD